MPDHRAQGGGQQAGRRGQQQSRPRPEASETRPAIGPPMGVEPRNATAHSAITRPRIAGSAAQLQGAVALGQDARRSLRRRAACATSSRPELGASAAARMATPKTVGRPDQRPQAGARRGPPTYRPPMTAPTPIAAVMKPYASAPPWKVSLATTRQRRPGTRRRGSRSAPSSSAGRRAPGCAARSAAPRAAGPARGPVGADRCSVATSRRTSEIDHRDEAQRVEQEADAECRRPR